MLTKQQLAEIKDRVDLATKGPWKLGEITYNGTFPRRSIWSPPFPWNQSAIMIADLARPDDAYFITAARQDIPALLESLTVARKALTQIANLCQETCLTLEAQSFRATEIALNALKAK